MVLLAVVVVVWLGIKFFDERQSRDEHWATYCTLADSVLRSSHGTRKWEQSKWREFYRDSPRSYVVEINGADSVALVKVYGIGPTFAHRILRRRNELGGFYALEQLSEIRGITNEVLERVTKSFLVDSGSIKKININFAPLNVLRSHPYFTPNMVRRIEMERMKGGFFRNHKELIDKDILLPKEARRVAPYLSFENN